MTIVEQITFSLCEGIECNNCTFNDFDDKHSECLLQRRLEQFPSMKLLDKLLNVETVICLRQRKDTKE